MTTLSGYSLIGKATAFQAVVEGFDSPYPLHRSSTPKPAQIIEGAGGGPPMQ